MSQNWSAKNGFGYSVLVLPAAMLLVGASMIASTKSYISHRDDAVRRVLDSLDGVGSFSISDESVGSNYLTTIDESRAVNDFAKVSKVVPYQFILGN